MYARSRLILLLLVIEMMCQSNLHRQRSDLAHQPHACWLQQERSSLRRWPSEVSSTIADRVDVAQGARPVPESAAVPPGTVVSVVTGGQQVVVTVIRGEHHTVMVVGECIAGVTRVSKHVKRVVTRLPGYIELTVLGVVPGVITWVACPPAIDVKSQLVAAA